MYGRHRSPPSRWCGLKYHPRKIKRNKKKVTTFAVVWIEITSSRKVPIAALVTTFAVVWIEICG